MSKNKGQFVSEFYLKNAVNDVSKNYFANLDDFYNKVSRRYAALIVEDPNLNVISPLTARSKIKSFKIEIPIKSKKKVSAKITKKAEALKKMSNIIILIKETKIDDIITAANKVRDMISSLHSRNEHSERNAA